MATTSIAASRAALVPSSSSWAQDGGGALKALPRSAFLGSGVCCGSSSSKSSSTGRALASADLVLDGLVKAEDGKDEKRPAASAAEAKSFITDVASLLKLVDSKDIVELEVKHKDYEITIRKAEALQQPAAPATPPSMPQMFPGFPPYPAFSPPPQAAAPQPSAAAAPSPSPAAEAAPPAPITPAHPPMLSPMAGTFYRCPGPGEPPFVKVGDRVRKGQVICIIEAMKLMNTIECDQDGTVQDILVEDGKPVSVDMPLFVIKA